MFRQINEYMDVLLSRHQCGFRKGYSTRQCLLAMLEKWRSPVDNKKTFRTLLKRHRDKEFKLGPMYFKFSCTGN